MLHRRDLMRISCFIAAVELMAATGLIGCSKKSYVSSPQLALMENATKLGAVELVPGKPTRFNLGSGNSCVLTGRPHPDGIDLRVELWETNANGIAHVSQSDIITSPGRQCSIVMDSVPFALTAKLKAQ
jgi:hypothetical protein